MCSSNTLTQNSFRSNVFLENHRILFTLDFFGPHPGSYIRPGAKIRQRYINDGFRTKVQITPYPVLRVRKIVTLYSQSTIEIYAAWNIVLFFSGKSREHSFL